MMGEMMVMSGGDDVVVVMRCDDGEGDDHYL